HDRGSVDRSCGYHALPASRRLVVVRINLLLLLAVSILPFPTRLLAEFLSHESGRRVAAVVLGMNLLLAVFLLSLLLRAALRRGLVHPDVDDEEVSLLTRR